MTGNPQTDTSPTGTTGTTDLVALQALSATELLALARASGLATAPHSSRAELLVAVLSHELAHGKAGYTEGVLELLPDGYAFLRSQHHDYSPGAHDVYVSPAQVRALNLRTGHLVAGPVRGPKPGEKHFALVHIDRVNGSDADALHDRVAFAARTPVLPTARLRLDHASAELDQRAIDLLAPWGKGQRVLVTVPQGLDRTAWLGRLAKALRHNHPELLVVACLLDQRPEDSSELRRQLAFDRRCEVAAADFDEPAARQVAIAEATLARAQCEVEAGSDVVLLCDSLTALARASHVEQPSSGRLLCIGLDARAVLLPKRLFAAARACAEGGSLTVIATAVADPDSRLDEAIREQFVHRGNSEVVFDGGLVAQHAELALDVVRTHTRNEDLLGPPAAVAAVRGWRRELVALPPAERLAAVMAKLQATNGTGSTPV